MLLFLCYVCIQLAQTVCSVEHNEERSDPRPSLLFQINGRKWFLVWQRDDARHVSLDAQLALDIYALRYPQFGRGERRGISVSQQVLVWHHCAQSFMSSASLCLG